MSEVDVLEAPSPISLDSSTVGEYVNLLLADPNISAVLLRAEELVRQRCSEALALWPATTGLRPRITLLVKRAAILVDGPTSRLARALVKAEPDGWRLDVDPIAGALRACAMLDAQISELCRAATLASAVSATFDRLDAEYSTDVPRAWRHWTDSHAVDRSTIERAQSADELENIGVWLEHVERELDAWRGAIREWLGESTASAAIDANDAIAAAPIAALEYRYEILLKLGFADRVPIQRRSALAIREHVRTHLKKLAHGAVIGRDDGLLRIAEDYAVDQPGAAMSYEEIGTYVLALDHYGSAWQRAVMRDSTPGSAYAQP
jgi:hypothetical protein